LRGIEMANSAEIGSGPCAETKLRVCGEAEASQQQHVGFLAGHVTQRFAHSCLGSVDFFCLGVSSERLFYGKAEYECAQETGNPGDEEGWGPAVVLVPPPADKRAQKSAA